MRATEFTRPIQTERLTLRMPILDDIDPIHAFQSREDVCTYLLYEPRDRATIEEKITEAATKSRLENSGDWIQPTIERRDDQQVIGLIYLNIDSAEHQSVEVGWILHPDYSGQGYATEAASAAVDFAFGTMGAHRVIAKLDPANDASVRLCRRLGMRKEAHYLEDIWVKGEWGDTGVYAMLDREWSATDR
ncbi:GNAT family N-acetyltransferase [Mycetocola zhujimingii]|uniref:GNAT family N-acetyltransferase n=1 Tax=Mycetocola zhujimingii TaxID=2079792 RepID=UPI000D375938|nr:GNAT family protein [Mycetocola zhujimingii]AWB85253.1 N-acetyltransferase [Mycetocola zhujimingii]